MESGFESKSRCDSLRPAAMATGSGGGGWRGTVEGHITLLHVVQHNPHTHTPTSLTSSPPPLTYTLTPSQPHSLTTSPHIPTYSPGVSSFFPSHVPQCVHICHTRVLVLVHLNEPSSVQLDPRLVNPKVHYVSITPHSPEETVNTRDLLGLPLLCVGNKTDGEGVTRLLDFTNLWRMERQKEEKREGGRKCVERWGEGGRDRGGEGMEE